MNFIKLFDDYKIDYTTRENKGWVNVKCPYCDDHSHHGGFNMSKDYYNCWKCGSHSFLESLAKILNVNIVNAHQIVNQYGGNDNDVVLESKKRVETLHMPSYDFLPIEEKYLESRNFNPYYLHRKFGVCGGGIAGEWKYRIIIPIIYEGKLVSWTGRSILEKKKLDDLGIPRYKNLAKEKSVISCKEVLFNMDNSIKDKVILTEGAFDVMRFGDDCICSFGTELSQEQIMLIANRYNTVYILFDDEKEAQQKANKYGNLIYSLGVNVEIVNAYSEYGVNDGAELTEEQVEEIKYELEI